LRWSSSWGRGGAESTITVQPAPNADPARLQVRKNVDALSPQELADLRRAITQALQLNDTPGFDYFAGRHGVSFAWCVRGARSLLGL